MGEKSAMLLSYVLCDTTFLIDSCKFFILILKKCFSIHADNMNTELQNNNTVNEELKGMIESYLARHPSLTLNALAKRSGVSATTLRRLMTEQVQQSIAPHSVLALVSYLLKEKSIAKILKTVQGAIAELLNKSFNQFIFDESNEKYQQSQDLNELFKDKTNYLIYKLAANHCGTSVEEIKDHFGRHGLVILEGLLAKKILSAEGDGRIHAHIKNFSVDLMTAKNLTHELIDQYKVNDIDKGFNLFYSLSEALNEEGIKAVKKIELDAVKKVHELMNKPEYMGMIPYFSIFMSEVIGATPVPLKSVEVYQ